MKESTKNYKQALFKLAAVLSKKLIHSEIIAENEKDCYSVVLVADKKEFDQLSEKLSPFGFTKILDSDKFQLESWQNGSTYFLIFAQQSAIYLEVMRMASYAKEHDDLDFEEILAAFAQNDLAAFHKYFENALKDIRIRVEEWFLNRTYETERLYLRPFKIADAAKVNELMCKEIIDNAADIPDSYSLEKARAWISRINYGAQRGVQEIYAICLKDTKEVIGAIGFLFNYADYSADLGYWVGKKFWGQGFATESARFLIDHVFKFFDAHSVDACYFSWNKKSENVLKKSGMSFVGTTKKWVRKWNRFANIGNFAIKNPNY